MENSQLLCTFTKKKYVDDTLSLITEAYASVKTVFVLQNTDIGADVYCTYNVDTIEVNKVSFLKNTISVHRNKATNTLYTINAVNSIVLLMNDGNKDNSYKIDWNLYRNTILVTNEDGIKKINTKLLNIVTI